MKKIIIAIVITVIVGITLWLFIPRRSRIENTIRCYDLNGVDFSLSDDTCLEEIADYKNIECSLEINYSLVFGTRLEGTVKIDGTEYNADSRNFNTDNDWIGALLSFDDRISLYLSSDRNYIMLQDAEKEKCYWVGAEDNMGELKKACKSFGLNYYFA